MNRETHISLGCQLAKGSAPFLLPGKPLGEGELEATMPLLYKRIEELGIFAGFGRQMRDSKPNRAHLIRLCRCVAVGRSDYGQWSRRRYPAVQGP